MNIPRLMRVPIHPGKLATLRFRINVRRISRVLEHPESVAVQHVFPVRVGYAAREGRSAHPGAVILQAAVDMIGIGIVGAYVIKLRNRQVQLVLPAVAAVFAAPQAPVVAGDHNVGVLWIDPHIVEISVRRARDHVEALPSIVAQQQNQIGLEYLVFVRWIDDQIAEVERTPHDIIARILRGPCRPAVVRSIESAAFFRFDIGVNHKRLRGRHLHRNASPGLGRKSLGVAVGDFAPMRAKVR